MDSSAEAKMTENAVTPPATDLNVIGRYATETPRR